MARPRKEQNEPQNDIVVENDDVVLDNDQSESLADDAAEEQADYVQPEAKATEVPQEQTAQEMTLDDAHKNGIGTAVPAAE